MEAWSNDTTKKEEKENQEKKEMGYKVFLRIVVPYEGFRDILRRLMQNWEQ